MEEGDDDSFDDVLRYNIPLLRILLSASLVVVVVVSHEEERSIVHEGGERVGMMIDEEEGKIVNEGGARARAGVRVRVGMIEIRMVIDEDETMIVTVVNGARAEKRARAGMIDMKIGHDGGARAGTGVRAGIIDFRMIIDEENRAIVMSLEGGSVITIEGQKAIMNTTGETSLGGQGGQKASLEEEGQVREIVL